jgi:hypothetical protein
MNKTDLFRKKIAHLRVLAKFKGIRNILKLKKSELVAKILAREKNAAPTKRAPTLRKSVGGAKPAKSQRRIAKQLPPRPPRGVTAPPQIANPQSPVPLLAPADKQEIVAHKFDLEPLPAPQSFAPDAEENLGELPESYGTKKLVLIARDPHWLYAYWDFTSQQLAEARHASRDHCLVLRVFETGNPFPVQEIPLHQQARNWYLHVGKAGATWRAQLGYFRHDGAFHVISESGRATTPRDFLGSRAPQRFVTIPADWSLRQLFDLVRGHQRAEEKLADVLHRLQMAGFPFPFEIGTTASEWTLEQERALYQLLGGKTLRQARTGSLDFGEWLRRRLLEQISSSSAASLATAH